MGMILEGPSKLYRETPLILLMHSLNLAPKAISFLSRYRIDLSLTTLIRSLGLCKCIMAGK